MEEYTIEAQKCAEHLSGIIQFPTTAHEVEEGADFSPFYDLHAYLEKTYPLVHKTLEKEIVGKAGLLYHWKGTGKSGKAPLLLMAHQDVVPAGEESEWTYPPFSGTIADGKVWGRGTCDCKGLIIAQMEALEHLISIGFVPDYDLYLSYSYNEEIGSNSEGDSGAMMAARLLKERGIRPGAVIDEGGGMRGGKSMGVDLPLCTVALGEKGYVDYEISRRDPGGHAARPGKNGALTYVARAILAIEEHPLPYRLTDTIRVKYETLAPYIREKDPEFGELLTDMEGNWEKLIPYLEADRATAAMFHTTMAMTMASGSAQANVLPEKASVIVNCRLLSGDTMESVKEYIESIIPDGMEVKILKGNEASPVSPYDGEPLKDLLIDISRELYGDSIAIPDIMSGGTDARRMYEICDCVYRFAPFYNREEGRSHAADEAMNIEALADGPRFECELIRRYGTV